jgi:putative membrane protein
MLVQMLTMVQGQADSGRGDRDEPEGPNRVHDPEPDVRFSYANERTFLAWIRTSLGFITAGLAITQLIPPFRFSGGRRLIGLPLIAVGVLIAAFSFWNWKDNERAMREQRPLPRSPIPLISSVVVGVIATIALVLVIVEG